MLQDIQKIATRHSCLATWAPGAARASPDRGRPALDRGQDALDPGIPARGSQRCRFLRSPACACRSLTSTVKSASRWRYHGGDPPTGLHRHARTQLHRSGSKRSICSSTRKPAASSTRRPRRCSRDCEALLEGQVAPEFLQCQIEVGTRVCTTVGDARADLERLRGTVASVARSHGLRLVAASTHPFRGVGRAEAHREGALRDHRARSPGGGAPSRHLRHARPRRHRRRRAAHRPHEPGELCFSRHLLALGTSSPFWQGHHTGLKSYRISVWTRCRAPDCPSTSKATANSSASSTCSPVPG